MVRTKIDRKDWRNLPIDKWNTLTVLAMIDEMNRIDFGVEKYVPMRSWSFERGVVKRALDEYGAEVVREVVERAFREYRPSREYPQLTAGFIFVYMASRIVPRVLVDLKTRRTPSMLDSREDVSEIKSWL